MGHRVRRPHAGRSNVDLAHHRAAILTFLAHPASFEPDAARGSPRRLARDCRIWPTGRTGCDIRGEQQSQPPQARQRVAAGREPGAVTFIGTVRRWSIIFIGAVPERAVILREFSRIRGGERWRKLAAPTRRPEQWQRLAEQRRATRRIFGRGGGLAAGRNGHIKRDLGRFVVFRRRRWTGGE